VIDSKDETISADSYSVPLKEFHLFPRLPAELRLKIYGFAMTQVSLFPLLIISLRAQRVLLCAFSI
jgi:hypothetical protein